MAKTLDLQPSKIVMTDEDTLATYSIYAHNGGIDINAKIRPNLIHAPADGDLQILSESGYRLSLMTDGLAEVLGYDNDDGIISMPLQSGCLAYRSDSNQSISDICTTLIEFNSKLYDVQNEYDNSTNYRFTAKVSGYYLVLAQIKWVNFAEHRTSSLSLNKNGVRIGHSLLVSDYSYQFTQNACIITYLDANDYIEATIYQNTGSNRELQTGADGTFLVVQKIA